MQLKIETAKKSLPDFNAQMNGDSHAVKNLLLGALSNIKCCIRNCVIAL